MIGPGAPAVGGPNDLDALLYPPEGSPVRARTRPRVHAHRGRQGDRDRAGRLLPRLDLQRHRSRAPSSGQPKVTPCESTSSTPARPAHDPLSRHSPDEHGRRIRDRASRWSLHLRVRGEALRHAALPLPRHPAQETHPQGAVRRADHRPEGASRARAGARDGDERLRHRRRRGRTTSTRSTAAPSITRGTRSRSSAPSPYASISST